MRPQHSPSLLTFVLSFGGIIMDKRLLPCSVNACRVAASLRRSLPALLLIVAVVALLSSFSFGQAAQVTQAAPTHAAPAAEVGGEASLKLPNLRSVNFIGGFNGHNLLLVGILFCLFGWLFGLVIYVQLKNLPVHRSMREVSELIYETCKTYLSTQGKFIVLLWVFIAVIIGLYFGYLSPVPGKPVALTLP